MAMRTQFFDERIVGKIKKDFVSLFTYKFGRVMRTAATEFIVVDGIGVSPWVYDVKTGERVRPFNGGVGLRINTTDYFLSPDGSFGRGISGRISSPERMIILEPDIYILSGQIWDLTLSLEEDDKIKKKECIHVVSRYILYDGSDSVFANQLLEMGISIGPKNIDWLKRKLLEQEKSCSSDTIYDCGKYVPWDEKSGFNPMPPADEDAKADKKKKSWADYSQDYSEPIKPKKKGRIK